MTEHDDLRDWDAAYLLGSLSADDRRRYERHLADCGACAAWVAELAGVPGLLGKLPPVEAEELLDHRPPQAPDLLPKLASHVSRRRHRRVRRWALALTIGAIAVGVAIAAAVFPGFLESPDQEQEPVSVAVELERVAPSPLVASIRLVEEEWGTLVEMECQYARGGQYTNPAEYAMVVIDDSGDEVRVATWTAAPGQTATPSGTTALARTEIHSIEVRSTADGTVLLRGWP